MRRLKNQYMQGTKKSQIILSLILIASLACVAFVLWWFYKNTTVKNDSSANNQIVETQAKVEQTIEEKPETKTEPFDNVALQKIIEDWAGTVNPDEQYQGGRTRLECLDAMIRDSDSPCGEKLWEELGRQDLTDTLVTYGILNTSMTALSTTAEDAGMMLSRIVKGDGLSESSRQLYLSSMETQDALYRRGFPSGFTNDVTVYDKVGWNEQQEWHDVGIIKTADGRKLIYAVMTENVGSTQIAELAKKIEAIL